MRGQALCAIVIGAAVGVSGIACDKESSKAIAELAEATKTVERQRQVGFKWSPAQVGDEFSFGSAVRTGAGSEAKLRLTRGGELRLGPDTVVRFQTTPKREAKVQVETGDVQIISADETVFVTTSLGAVKILPSAKLQVTQGAGAARVKVMVGSAVLLQEDGEEVVLAEGQEYRIDIGSVIVLDDQVEEDEPVVEEKPEVKPELITAVIRGAGVQIQTKNGWQKMPKGEAEIARGSRIRLTRKAKIELRTGSGRVVATGKADIVVGDSLGHLVSVSHGKVSLYTAAGDVSATIPGGTVVASQVPGGSIAELSVTKLNTVIFARNGTVGVMGADVIESLETGEKAILLRAGDLQIATRAPTYADMSIAAGESPVIHDPKPPTAVAIRFAGKCPGRAIVEVAGRRRSYKRLFASSAGVGRANVLLPTGGHSYRVRCISKDGISKSVSAKGTVRIKRDAGKRRLPAKPAHSIVDADGREYTVLYQNHLPEVTFRWPSAPTGTDYRLLLKPSNGSTRTIKASVPRVKLASGELTEGSYKWWFESPKLDSRSPTTKLNVAFHSSGAAAYLERVSKDGGQIRISGAALPGSKVSVGSTKLSLDRYSRFKASISLPKGERAAAVRVSHPRRGLHYYVVRTKGK